MAMNNSSLAVSQYHQRTKHQLNAYAKGPESLDWDDQPNPFRRFIGCEAVRLDFPGAELAVLYAELDTPSTINAQPLTLSNMGLLFELAFGLSAWKQFGPDRWSLRCNPSSGNLHPTEVYLVCTDANLLLPGVYHYVSYEHLLERRSLFTHLGNSSEIYIGLSSLHWREAWKYGERAYRYCQHDTGHALAALSFAAACLGWEVELCSTISDADLSQLLGLNRHEDFVVNELEAPDLLCRINLHGSDKVPVFDLQALLANLSSADWFGKAERLSGRHFYRWPIIDEVSEQAQKPETHDVPWQPETKHITPTSSKLLASKLIRQRRSAQRFNAKAEPMVLQSFQRILSALLPSNKPPFSSWPWRPDIHLFLFVHQVEGLESGLYILPRDSQAVPSLKSALSADYLWQKIDMPFDFYCLATGRFQQAAKSLSCHQAIASDSAFSLGMLARFAENIDLNAWHYRRLFWESGLLGQVLYLEAEAAGLRGTGIGCFFDDAVHGVLGLQDDTWQSVYHFTVGQPLEDARIQTLPAYEHLLQNQAG